MLVLFDIDGTLTPSRAQIDPEFQLWLKEFMLAQPVCFVTGSDQIKTVEQIGQELFDIAEYSFNCAGNVVYKRGRCVFESEWTCPDDLWQWLEDKLYNSAWIHRYGRHFEPRPGMLNFSVIGRNAQGQARRDYYDWDQVNNERICLAEAINLRWPKIQAVVGGETGIDIFPRGHDKSQVLQWLTPTQELVFFGDRMDPAGNDHSLAQAILTNNRGRCYHVKDWKHTWQLLRELDDNNLLPQGRS